MCSGNCDFNRYPCGFWAHPGLRTRGLNGPWWDVSTRRKERNPESMGQPQPPRKLVKPQKHACYFSHTATPQGLAGRGGKGCLSCPWVCRRFACVCLAQSLYLTGTRETDFINRCEHEWFLWLACFQSPCLTGVCVPLSKYFYGDSIHNTMVII